MYVFRDINNYPVYFKIQLVKYEIKKNTSFVNPAAPLSFILNLN